MGQVHSKVKIKDEWVLVVLALLGFVGSCAIVWQQRANFLQGRNDFIPLYSAPWLISESNLYDATRLHEISDEKTGMWSIHHGFIRLPFHAAALWPLSRLSYSYAYFVWQAASLLAIVGFVALWNSSNKLWALVFTSLSLPLLHAWLKGQDVTFLLLLLALTIRLQRAGRTTLAGVVFSLCSIKFHLFLLTPVLIVGQRAWRFGAGLLAGGSVLAAVSFAAGGWTWPADFLESAINPMFSPGVSAMPNLHGALSQIPSSSLVESLLTVTVIAASWLVARRAPFPYAFASSLAGGLLLSHHSYLLDTAILLPACMIVIALTQHAWIRSLAILLLLPPTHFLIAIAYPYSAVMTGVILLFAYSMAWEAWRGVAPAADVASVRGDRPETVSAPVS